jgi:hypothetical protein
MLIVNMKITGQQLRMARIALKWRVDDLSKKCDVNWAKIQQLERSDDFLPENDRLQKIIDLFHNNNIIFLEETNEHKPGILIKK